MKKDKNRYPKGLNQKKVEELIEYYENQPEDEAIADIERALDRNSGAHHEPVSPLVQTAAVSFLSVNRWGTAA